MSGETERTPSDPTILLRKIFAELRKRSRINEPVLRKGLYRLVKDPEHPLTAAQADFIVECVATFGRRNIPNSVGIALGDRIREVIVAIRLARR